ncbi:RT0821/Lpp0805 family surface protein [Rhizobium sp. HT1-10]|uniref:RT0821/Lpp0805 family surface protein n=1 Tax=Rhizobium sp. HT1-10 TaxID=3111638 RepID=UPI003C1EAC61
MEVIAKSTVYTKGLLSKRGMIAATVMVLLSLTGCTTGGMDLFSSTKVDRSVTTSAVPKPASAPDTVSDEVTVRNAVTSADLSKLKGQPLAWANASTGSAGVIDTIVENNATGQVCRQFRTTRHAYDGIANFYGKACLVGDNDWQVLAFQPQS